MPFLKCRNKTPYSKHLELISKRQGLRHAIFNTVGDKYIGEWDDDNKTGKGTMLTRFKQLYEGDFFKGYRHGFGVLAFQRPNKKFVLEYRGFWRMGRMHGFGMRRYRDGSIYIGDWKWGKRHGFGLMWYANGEFYAGDWARDKRDGLGMFIFVSLDRYEGEWRADKKHGRGRYLHLTTGQVQNGVWIEDCSVQSNFADLKYRQTAYFTTPYPIEKIQLLRWDELCAIYEDNALLGKMQSCLDVRNEIPLE